MLHEHTTTQAAGTPRGSAPHRPVCLVLRRVHATVNAVHLHAHVVGTEEAFVAAAVDSFLPGSREGRVRPPAPCVFTGVHVRARVAARVRACVRSRFFCAS